MPALTSHWAKTNMMVQKSSAVFKNMLLGKANAGGVTGAVVVAEHRLCPAGDSTERHRDNQHEALHNRVAG